MYGPMHKTELIKSIQAHLQGRRIAATHSPAQFVEA
jgi:hypothetical protein